MTNTHATPDGAAIDRLLSEAGMEDDLELASFLLELRALSTGEPPTPTADVSALMGATPVKLRASKTSRHRRMLLIALTVTASLGMGVSAAAAVSPQVRDAAQNAIAFLVHTVAPGLGQPPTRSQVPASGSTHAPTAQPTSIPTTPMRTGIPSVSPAPRPTNPATVLPWNEPVPASPSRSNPATPPATPPSQSSNGNRTTLNYP